MNAAEHQLLGAYVLGGLEPAELLRFEQHLQECADCREELAGLERLPALLDALPVPDAVALTAASRPAAPEPATAVPHSVLDELAARRRRGRRRRSALVGAVAAACLALGLAAGPLLNRPPQPDASYSVQADGLRFSVDLVRKAWGTELVVNGRSMPVEGTYSLWVRDREGGEDRACAWTAVPGGRIKVTGATPVQLASIAGVELRDQAQQRIAVITVP